MTWYILIFLFSIPVYKGDRNGGGRTGSESGRGGERQERPTWLPLSLATAMSRSSLVSQNDVDGDEGRRRRMATPQAAQMQPMTMNLQRSGGERIA